MIEKELNTILHKKFPDAEIIIDNQSHLHAAHKSSPQSGDSHFQITVIDDNFEGKNRISRHQMVNNALSPLFSKGLHALSLRLFTHNEYKRMI